jgi:hypothetical protein
MDMISIKPLDTSSNNIPISYQTSNISEITFLPTALTPKNIIVINKNFMESNSIQLTINNFANLYIDTNYYIYTDQNILNPKILGIGSKYSVIQLTDKIVEPIANITSLQLGLQSILTPINYSDDPTKIKIVNTNNTLYDLLSRYNSNILLSEYASVLKTRLNIKTTVDSFNSDYYKNISNLGKSSKSTNFILSAISSIVKSIITDNSKNYSNNFYNMSENPRNHKFDIDTITSNINLANSITTYLIDILAYLQLFEKVKYQL